MNATDISRPWGNNHDYARFYTEAESVSDQAAWLGASGSVSYKFLCGCSERHGYGTDWPVLFFNIRQPGNLYPCKKHGDQVIVKMTLTLNPDWTSCPDCHGHGETSVPVKGGPSGRKIVDWASVECRRCDGGGLLGMDEI